MVYIPTSEYIYIRCIQKYTRLKEMKKLDKSDNGDKITTIKVTMSTRDKLAKLGTMDDNYDTVINRLIKECGKDL